MAVPSWFGILAAIIACSSSAASLSPAPTHVRGILVNVSVPTHERLGNYARLGCGYDMMGGEALYTLKWYKDLSEFFRFSPSERFEKRKEIRKLPGVSAVEESFPSHLVTGERSEGFVQTYITLKSVDLNSTGMYRCEITADGPPFATMFAEQNMVIVAIPDGPPEISGNKPVYHIGDEVKLDCVYGNAKPMPALTWYINGIKADNAHLTDHLPKADENKRETAGLELKFRLAQEHLPMMPLMANSAAIKQQKTYPTGSDTQHVKIVDEQQPNSQDKTSFSSDYWSGSSSLITSLFSSSTGPSPSSWTRKQLSSATAAADDDGPYNYHQQHGYNNDVNYGYRISQHNNERHTNNNRRMHHIRDRFYLNVTCSASISNVHYINATKQLRVVTSGRVPDSEINLGRHQQSSHQAGSSSSSSSLNHVSSNYVANSSASSQHQRVNGIILVPVCAAFYTILVLALQKGMRQVK